MINLLVFPSSIKEMIEHLENRTAKIIDNGNVIICKKIVFLPESFKV